MTVETDKSRRQFLGDGSKTKFPVDFRIYAEDEARVYVDETLKTLNVDYTISNINTALESFDVDFVTAPAANAVVTVSRSLARVQNTDYVEGDDFPADAHEDALDRLVMIVQELDDAVNRSLRFHETDEISLSPVLPPADERAGQLLGFDANGETIATQPSAALASAFMQTVLDDPDEETARETLGAASQADLDTVEADITALDGRVTTNENRIEALEDAPAIAAQVVQLSSVSNTSTVLVGLGDLEFPVTQLGTTVYFAEYTLFFSGDLDASGVKFQLVGPFNAGFSHLGAQMIDDTGASAQVVGDAKNDTFNFPPSDFGTGATRAVIRVVASLELTGDGTVDFRWAKHTAAVDALTLQNGSTVVARRS